MIIAKEKRRNNIAEYVLYMWQIEDLLRSFNFNFELVKQKIIDGYKTDELTTNEINKWYLGLIQMMEIEGIKASGHLQMLKNTINDMFEVHNKLLNKIEEEGYKRIFSSAKQNIDLFRIKSNNVKDNDIKICLNALYSLLLLRLSGKEVSIATNESMNSFSRLLAALSVKYKQWEEGLIEL